MAEISRAALFRKLNSLAYKTINSATAYCKLRGDPYVELAHWLHQILEQQDTDLHRIIHHFDVDTARLAADLTDALDLLPQRATAVLGFSFQVEYTIERGWTYATLLFGEPQVRTGYLLVALLKTADPITDLRGALFGISREFEKIKLDVLCERFAAIVAGSPEDGLSAIDGFQLAGSAAAHTAGEAVRPGDGGKQEALRRFTVDLTEQARRGEIDPIVGRDGEIRQIVDILMRRCQNNPILTGEAGVGKTAVVEGFARRIVDGDVPPPLQEVSLRILDVGLLQAGASVKGEFENRLRQVIDEVQSSPKPVILFIDEAHTLIGAGGPAGTGDAANLLKPARQLPDKAVSLLDTASARVAISLHAVPPDVDDCRRRLQALETELRIINKEENVGIDVAERETAALDKKATEEHRLAELEQRWEQEKDLIDEVLELRGRLRGASGKVEDTDSEVEKTVDEALPAVAGLDKAKRTELLTRLRELQSQLGELQGEQPLILASVEAQVIASVVAGWTGIPVGRMVKNEIEAVLRLADTLKQRVIGQDHALEMIARRVQTSRANLDNPGKPIGVFMLCGPSGVGKTETALALAESLYGGEHNVITINMSEFQEAHTVSTLKGAPPGYVGYGEGGVLTEAVRRKPYSVVLLDEVEKAHPDVHEIFFQVFDKGQMEDGEGRMIDFKNTLILLTSNVGSELIMNMCKDPELMPESEGIARALREPLLKVFPAALLGRLVMIPYYPLSDEIIGNIARLQLGRIERRIAENHRVAFSYDDAVVKLIVSRCTELESGGRMIDAILTNTGLPAISEAFLTRMVEGKAVERVLMAVEDREFGYLFDQG